MKHLVWVLFLPFVLGCGRSFNGKVVDARTNAPKNNVTVQIYDGRRLAWVEDQNVSAKDLNDPLVKDGLTPVSSSKTDENGDFSLSIYRRTVGKDLSWVLIVVDPAGTQHGLPIEASENIVNVLKYSEEDVRESPEQKLSRLRREKWRLH